MQSETNPDDDNILKKQEIVEKLKEKAFYVPFMAMGSSLITLYIGSKLLQTRPLKRPVLFQFGSFEEIVNVFLRLLFRNGTFGSSFWSSSWCSLAPTRIF
jgi:hypothetical protein